MVDRSELGLGQHVVVRLCGGETVGAVVDGLCNDWVGVRLDRGGYVIADWEDIEVEEEEVVRTEQGEVLAVKKAEECCAVNSRSQSLDSLRPSWKPSEEQMEALSDAWLACDDKEKCELLSSLYDDLKKLM